MPDRVLLSVERANPSLGVADLGLDAAHAAGGVDQLLVELGTILSERRYLGFELVLRLGSALLLLTHRVELLRALLDGIARLLWRGGGGLRGGRRLGQAWRWADGNKARDRDDRGSYRVTELS